MPVLLLAVLLSVLANASLGAQVSRVALGKGTTLLGEFSQIRGLRELPDGRVIVADRLEETVSVVDFTSGKRSP